MGNAEIKYHPVYTRYGCDKFGNLFSTCSGKLTRIGCQFNGTYYHFRPSLEGRLKNKYVHQFVYECWNNIVPIYGRASKSLTINHIDHDKSNNRLSNLELVTKRVNARDKIKTSYIYPKKFESGKLFYVQAYSRPEKKTILYGRYKTKAKAEARVQELKDAGILK